MPGTSVFQGSPQKLGGVIRAEDVKLTFPGSAGGGEGALVQQAQLTCERSVNMIYEIGSQQLYYVGDRRRGTANFSRVIGGSAGFKEMLVQFGDICKAKESHMVLQVGSGGCAGSLGGDVTYRLVSCTLTSVGLQVTAQEIVVTENMGFMFVELEYE